MDLLDYNLQVHCFYELCQDLNGINYLKFKSNTGSNIK